MKWFKSGEKQTWTPEWEHKVQGMFWQFKISEDGIILCEIRDTEKKSTTYSAITERSGEVLWQDLSFDEPWWIGIEDLSDGRAYFHKFRKPDMPQHIGIIAVDLQTGKVLWENSDLTFLLVDGLKVYATAQGFEARKVYLLEESTGGVAQEVGVDNDFINRLRESQNEEYLFRNYSYPSHFDDTHAGFNSYKDIVYDIVSPDSVVGNLDVLEHSGLLLCSWHETTKLHSATSPHLDQKFVAVEIASNSVIYTDTINAGVQADAIDSFFVKDQRLMYVKERSILTSLALPTD